MKRLDPAKLRYKVTIQQLDGTQETTGAPLKSWTDFTTVWVSIEDLGGQERLIAEQLFAGSNVRLRAWFIDGVKASMRVIYGSRIFDIQEAVDPDGERREIAMTCIERTESGS